MSDSWVDYRVRSAACGPREAQVLKDYLHNRINVNETSRIITSKMVNDDNPGYLLEFTSGQIGQAGETGAAPATYKKAYRCWEGQEGMSRKRWEFRKRRLEWIQGQKVDEATKEIVREAAAAMQAIDGQ
ncbi:hypothetical protein W97_02775 [Coniosporium apollinis CBS 100218]|uniref:Uncharacterized protein n=1 Tax=Coniosporium apollinis (strain CBS 100218) TaxID=1168221 RepID=R7YNT3_CONA1|nr:uncharacterized protein W97_02775 [Coniosporium apollinis CBS 100218]EON63547.1 hypothetical protein W97_02775 [Coniosporium apollinis CBS 100218]